MSHEIKTPLSLIHAYTAGNRDGVADAASIEVIISQVQRLNSLLDKLIEVSKLEKEVLHLSVFNLSDEIKENLKAFDILLKEKGISVNIRLIDNCMFKSDKDKLNIVIANLISNAIKYNDNFCTAIIGRQLRDSCKMIMEGGKNMDIKIEKKGAFKIAGIKAEGIDNSKCAEIWDTLFRKASLDDLARLGNGQSFGACYEIYDVNAINYMAAFDVKDEERAKELGLDILKVPEAEYAVVKLKGPVPKCIHEGWKYVMEVFFPEQGYKHAGTPDCEVYSEGDMGSPDYEMELWVPVVRA